MTDENHQKLWFGFIEPKASWSSVFALIIASVAGAYQAYWFFVGPDVRFIQPQQVMFNIAGSENVRMIIPLSFLNEAPSRYSDVIVSVSAQFSADLPDGRFTADYQWQNFTRSNPLAKEGEDGLIIEGAVVPLMVKGASAISRDTEFLATGLPECISGKCSALIRLEQQKKKWPFFWRHLVEASKHSKVFTIDLTARAAEGGEINAVCTIDIDDKFTNTLLGKTDGGQRDPYHAPPCVEAASET